MIPSMNVPHISNLHSQTFNAEFIEFVWQFPQLTRKELNQVIFKAHKDGSILLKEGSITPAGDFTNDDGFMTSGIISTKNISMGELDDLKTQVIGYLQS